MMGPVCVTGDRMGCGIRYSSGSHQSVIVFFTRNGKEVGFYHILYDLQIIYFMHQDQWSRDCVLACILSDTVGQGCPSKAEV